MEQLIAYQREDEILSKFKKPVQMKGDEEVTIGNYDSAPKLYGELFSIGIRTSRETVIYCKTRKLIDVTLRKDLKEKLRFSDGIRTSISLEDELYMKGSGTTYVRSDPGQVEVKGFGTTHIRYDPDDMLDFYLDPGQFCWIKH